MQESDIKRLYQSALNYKKASTLILNQNDNSLFLQGTVNQALALELILKCLLFIDRGSKIETHSHKKIFIQLNQELKTKLISDFSKFIALDLTQQQILALEQASGIQIAKDLISVLKDWSSIFVCARYEHELSGKHLSMMFFDELFDLINNSIKKSRLDW